MHYDLKNKSFINEIKKKKKFEFFKKKNQIK